MATAQEELDRQMVEGGISRYRRKVQTAREREVETDAPYAQRLMRSALPDYVKALAKDIRYHRKYSHAVPTFLPLVWDVEPQVLAFLAMKVTLDGISVKKPLANLAIALGTSIEDEVRSRWLKKNYPDVFKYASKDMEKAKRRSYNRIRNAYLRHELGEAKKGNIEPWSRWGRRDKLTMGTWFLETLRASTHFITFVTMTGEPGRPRRYVSATEDLFQWISEFNASAEVLTPMWMPMARVPYPWTSLWTGGYTDGTDCSLPPLTLIKSYDMDHLRSIDFDDMSPVVQAVNRLQEVPWAVNERVCEVARWAWDADLEVGGMPRRTDYEFPPFPEAAKTDPELKKTWSRKAGRIYELNLSLKSKRLQIIKTILLAEKFLGTVFHFPHQVDFRGRVYPVPYYLSPQGTDLAKGLLQFSEADTMWNPKTEAKWLAVHGANAFGIDKVSLDEREQWVHSRRNEIAEVCRDPRTNKWWMEADQPWSFLAFCFEWGALLECGGKGFRTRLPCCMDASNNGTQILSLLIRDEVGGRATNVTPNPTPEDLYAFVAEEVNRKLERRMKAGDQLAAGWFAFGIDRKLTKRPVMVRPYGGTMHSCRAYIDEWFHEQVRGGRKDPFGTDSFAAVTYLAGKVWRAMNTALRRPGEVMKWLQEVALLLAKEGKAVTWTTPLGFSVKQYYRKHSHRRLRTLLGEKSCQVAWNEWKDEIFPRRQVNGISPNFVHSLDAAAVHATVNSCAKMGIHSLMMVHDSYGTHATKCNELAAVLRHAYSTLFEEDLLAKFRNEVASTTERELPLLPSYGSLNPRDVQASEYFFA